MNGCYYSDNYYEFDFKKKTISFYMPYDDEALSYYSELPHEYFYMNEIPEDWQTEYYNAFMKSSKYDTIFKQVIEVLRYYSGNDTELVQIVVRFVQSAIQYDWEAYYEKGEIKYPYETFYYQMGICSDKSLLLAKFLILLDYDVLFFTFPKANHMAVGLRVNEEYGDYGTQYAFIETTSLHPIGRIPDRLEDDVTLNEIPDLIFLNLSGHLSFLGMKEIRENEDEVVKFFGEDYLFLNAKQQMMKEEILIIQENMESINKQIEEMDCDGMLNTEEREKCETLIDKYNDLIILYNDRIKSYNETIDNN